MEKQYVLVYDTQYEAGYGFFCFNSIEDFKESLLSVANEWSNVNWESDYREYLYQKYGNDFYNADYDDEANDFEAFVSKLVKKNNGYDYLSESGFKLYKITKSLYESLEEGPPEHPSLISRFSVDINSNDVWEI